MSDEKEFYNAFLPFLSRTRTIREEMSHTSDKLQTKNWPVAD